MAELLSDNAGSRPPICGCPLPNKSARESNPRAPAVHEKRHDRPNQEYYK
jgi:hypothetical protein